MPALVGEERSDVDAELCGDELKRGQRRDGDAGLDLREVAGGEAAVGGELLEGQALLAPQGLQALADMTEARFHCSLLS
jgi:hypothetical protein